MVAGWDESGPGRSYVDSAGQRTRGKLFSVGSGSLYAYGVLDEGYRWDLSVDEAVELGQRSIYHATFRDAASGGTVSGALRSPSGCRRFAAPTGCLCCAACIAARAFACAVGQVMVTACLHANPTASLLLTLCALPPPCLPAAAACLPAVYHVTRAGWTKVRGEDVGELHYKYYPQPERHPCSGNDPLEV